MRSARCLSLAMILATAAASAGNAASRGKIEEAIRHGAWEDAAAFLESLSPDERDTSWYWSTRGLVLREMGRWDEAEAAYQRALVREAGNLRALVGLARVALHEGHTDAAFDFLAQAVRAGLPAAYLEHGDDLAPFRREAARFQALLEAARNLGSPCDADGLHDAFDFWVGDWDVYAGGRKTARNVITRELDGCLIRERYAAGSGYAGESLNYVHPLTGQWEQTWVDNRGGVVRYRGGPVSPGVMRMAGTATRLNGANEPARVTWTRRRGGGLFHRIEQSPDGGRTWRVVFDAVYVPHGSAPPGEDPEPDAPNAQGP